MVALAKIETAERKAAQTFVTEAATVVGNEAIRNIVLPTIERVLRGDLQVVDLHADEAAGLVKAVRSKGLGYRLKRLGLHDDQVAIAMRFCQTFEKARIGGLTANYDGFSGGAKRSSEPERWLLAMEELAHASQVMTDDERVVVYGYLLFDVSSGDLGGHVVGGLTGDKNMMWFTTKLYLNKALNKLDLFYQDLEWQQENIRKRQKGLATCP